VASVTASVGLLFVAVVLEATHPLACEELRWVLSALATAVVAAAMAGNDEIGVVDFAFQCFVADSLTQGS
jgi:hypothetical protein